MKTYNECNDLLQSVTSITMVCVIGPSDDGEPVITIMLPGED